MEPGRKALRAWAAGAAPLHGRRVTSLHGEERQIVNPDFEVDAVVALKL